MQTFNYRSPLFALWSEQMKKLLFANDVPLLFSNKAKAIKAGKHLVGSWYVVPVEVCGPDNAEIDGSIGDEDDQWYGPKCTKIVEGVRI